MRDGQEPVLFPSPRLTFNSSAQEILGRAKLVPCPSRTEATDAKRESRDLDSRGWPPDTSPSASVRWGWKEGGPHLRGHTAVGTRTWHFRHYFTYRDRLQNQKVHLQLVQLDRAFPPSAPNAIYVSLQQLHPGALYLAKECISITILNLHKKPLKMLLDKLEVFKYILPDSLAVWACLEHPQLHCSNPGITLLR